MNDASGLRDVIRGSVVCANCTSHYFNVQIMAVCYDEGCHYTDIGGLFHWYREQVKENEKWKAKGLTAVLGMGSAPGITNVLARAVADRLDTIEYLHLRDGIANHAKSDFPLSVPYNMGTILQEFNDPCYCFEDGDWKELPAFSQPEVIDFPDPVGTMTCFSTIHTEVASIPESYKSKGIRHTSFKLGLPGSFEPNMRFLTGIGFGNTEPIDVNGAKISPRDFFVALSDTFPKPTTGELLGYKCLRVDGKGTKDGLDTIIQADVMCYPYKEWNLNTGPYSVGVPCGIICRMLGKGEIEGPGCLAPELCVPVDLFLTYLGERGNIHSTITVTKPMP
ncbi:MAG: saccharopine dehydrogenase NADP-binding domain-containing protein [Deltaproteobacteria bacterium]|nr:saccharopine dehydrogenase NADP-binding domain-containing protein [Deltaproteobacteria bacterium]